VALPPQSRLKPLRAPLWSCRHHVRQLEQVIRRTIIDAGGLTDAEAAAHALQSIAPREEAAALAEEEPRAKDDLVSLDEAERRHIAAVLKATGGNQTQAAFILGIERKTLARKIKRLDIRTDD
jgi:DNA-binding NtrC family response regulator